MSQIDRTGTVHFHDASLAIWEEGISDARAAGGPAGADAWERQFKADVFKRIIQTLNRLDWTVAPWDRGKDYACIALSHRTCSKGDLRGELDLCGRHIEFKMWQGVNTPTRPDHGGRYEMHKEAVMPYVLRLEMERTRRRIRDYLCNVFSGYTFEAKPRNPYHFPLDRTALQRIQDGHAESCHFNGDWAKELARHEPHGMPSYNRQSADGVLLVHDQRVWFFDHHGRCGEGRAFYGDGMWWVAFGRYGLTRMSASELWTVCPPSPRVKRNAKRRRATLEKLLAEAIKGMRFERAAVLRDILNPTGEQLYLIQCKKDGLYFAPNYCGYRRDQVDAGKYTRAELRPYLRDTLEDGDLRAVPLVAEAQAS